MRNPRIGIFMNTNKLKNLGRLALFSAAFFWGISFVLMKNVLSSIPALYVLAIRFCGAAVVLLPFCIKKTPLRKRRKHMAPHQDNASNDTNGQAVKPHRKLDRAYIFNSALLGAALFLAYAFQTYGLQQTTPGKNAFLTSAYCIIVPFLYWAYGAFRHKTGLRGKDAAAAGGNAAFDGNAAFGGEAQLTSVVVRKRPDKFNAAAAIICVAGIGLISLERDLSIGTGDALTIICGFFFAVHIIMIAGAVEKRDPIMIAMLQFAAAGILSMICAFIFDPVPSGVTAADVWGMVFLTVVSTAFCIVLQIFGQKYTPPSQAAVILTLESVFGAVSSVIIYHEVMTFRLIFGFALSFAAVVISETKLGFLRKKSV